MKPADLMTEDMLHIYTADVLRAFALPGVMWWHTPNQNKHKVQYRVKLKQMGVRAGVSDFIIFVSAICPCFLELKDATGKQSVEQKKFQRDAEYIGVPYAIARTPAEVDRVLTDLGAIDKSIRGTTVAGRGSSGRMGAANVVRRRSHSSKSSPRASESR